MLIPIRCWSCGKPVAQLWEKFNQAMKSGESLKEVMTKLGLTRQCCRALFLANVDNLDIVASYKKE